MLKAGGSMTKVFHQEMINWNSKPCYRNQTMGWVEGEAAATISIDCLKSICTDCDLDFSFIPLGKTVSSANQKALVASPNISQEKKSSFFYLIWLRNWYMF
jgi:hypothetical protein